MTTEQSDEAKVHSQVKVMSVSVGARKMFSICRYDAIVRTIVGVENLYPLHV